MEPATATVGSTHYEEKRIMYYVIDAGHPSIDPLVELSEAIAEQERPISCATASEVAEFLMKPVSGAPEPTAFDVLALDHEDRDIHVLLRDRTDGRLARASYIEGDDIGDDISIFEYLSDENRQQILARFDRWCQHHLEEEDEAAYRALVADMRPMETTAAHVLEQDRLMIASTMEAMEGLGGRVATPALRDAIAQAVLSIKKVATTQ